MYIRKPTIPRRLLLVWRFSRSCWSLALTTLLVNLWPPVAVNTVAVIPMAVIPMAVLTLAVHTGANAQEGSLGGSPENEPENETDSEASVEIPPVFSYDPTVEAIEELAPQTAEELFQASLSLLDLGRHDLANQTMNKLAAINPSPADMVALHQRFGSAPIIRLTIDGRIDAAVRQFASGILATISAYKTDRRRLDQLAKEVGNDSPQKRIDAKAELIRSGGAAVAPVLAAIQETVDPNRRNHLLSLLVRIGSAAEKRLIAALTAREPAVRQAAMQALGEIGSEKAVLHLLRPALTGEKADSAYAAAAIQRVTRRSIGVGEAGQLLHERVLGLLDGRVHLAADYRGICTRWRWTDGRQDFDKIDQRCEVASAAEAARLSRDLHHIMPHSEQYRRTYLLAHLQAAKLTHGLARALPTPAGSIFATAVQEDPRRLDSLLKPALELDLVPAAIGLCEVLAKTGDPGLLVADDSQRAPLAEALIHSDRRLRVAAAHAILAIGPSQLFPGACDVTKVLDFVIRTQQERRVLIVHPNQQRGYELAGLCRELGFAGDVTGTGPDALRMAFGNPDYEFIFINDRVPSPRWTELRQLFRRDPRTADLPIAILSRGDQLLRAERVERIDSLTVVFPYVSSTNSLTALLSQLTERLGAEPIRATERMRQAEWAMSWLDQTSRSRKWDYLEIPSIVPSLVHALQQPRLSPSAARILGRLGTPNAQKALLDLVHNDLVPMDARESAFSALSRAMDRQGVQLTTNQILEQYELYNSSLEAEGEETRLLGSVLDNIEKHPMRRDPSRNPRLPRDDPSSG